MSAWRTALAALALLPALAAAQSLADLAVVRQGDSQAAIATNRSGGPVQVELVATQWQDMHAEPALPLQRVLRPGERATLAVLSPAGPAPRQALELWIVPGEPHAVPRDVVYSLPVEESVFRLGQGFHGSYSHADEANRYAVDLEVPEGTPVLAARDGVVLSVASGHGDGAPDPSLAGAANYIRVLHEDGTMALYGHLREGGVFVRPGHRVTLGQVIGESGNTGFSSGPHLHFVLQVNAGMRLESVPFRMIGPDGFLPLR